MTGYLENVAENGYRLDVVQNLFGATGWVIFQVSQLVCLGFTSYLAIRGKVTIGDVVLYQSYYTTIITQLTNIMNLVPIMAKGFESLHSIGEVMASYDEEDYTKGCAFLIGNEGNGLRDEVSKCADCLIRIPMCGKAESLNAAVAAAVLMFEAGRQRRK